MKHNLYPFALLTLVGILTVSTTGCEECDDDGVCDSEFGGYYYDSLVSGVAYETTDGGDASTRTGTTGEAGDPGRFTYQAGETVAFSVGDTRLGAAAAAARLTPFDLAGVAEKAVGGCEADGTLPEDGDSFQIVANVATLLQTLDTDGDPTNDITISTEVTALFDGVSVDVDQPVADFQADADLQAVLDAANTQSLFPDTRTLRTTQAALKALYLGLELCPSAT